MFTSLRTELVIRLGQVAELCRLVDSLEKRELSSGTTEPALRSLKGLSFVHLYAAYEYTVINSFSVVARQFNAYGIPYGKVRRSLLSLVLHPAFESLREIQPRKCWPGRIELMETSTSANASSLQDNVFPLDDSHHRAAQLDTICSILGLQVGALLPAPRFRGLIQDVVENRNAIAHGRETAEYVGSRYTAADLAGRLQQMTLVLNHLLNTLEAYALTQANFEV
jgi:hypothetical protein